jgi:response regulator RpfG family c-di-GMP phosphodiesterase
LPLPIAESRDPETGYHLERIRNHSLILARALAGGPSAPEEIDQAFLDNLFLTSVLRDIGKVGIPDNALLKQGSLTPAEFTVMQGALPHRPQGPCGGPPS